MLLGRRRWRIVWTIGVLFTGLNVVGIGSVLVIDLRGAAQNTQALVLERLEDAIGTAADGLDRIIQPVVAQATEIADALRAGRIDTDNHVSLGTYLAGVMATTPQVVGLAVADADLSFVAFARYGQASLRGMPTRDTLAETVAWARDNQAPRWVNGWSPTLNQPVVMLQTPLHIGGSFYGVLASVVTLASLHDSTRWIAEQVGHPVFILYRRELVIAASSGLPTFHPAAEHPLATLAETGDPVLARLWDAAGVAMASDELISGVLGHRLDTPEGPVTFIYRPVGIQHGNYLIGTYFRGSLAEAEQARLRAMEIAGGVVLVLSVLLSILLGRRIGHPVRKLAGAAAVIERQDYDAFRPLAPSTIVEIDDAGKAFNLMVDGLKERQRIRDLFGKYVANEVVERLIAEPGAVSLGGERRAVSLVFSDIAGFTTLSETMAPGDVLKLLNGYFEEICASVHAHDGVIIDFIGDAVFAIFGAPIARPDHAARALACARDMDRVAGVFAAARNAEGIALGRTRIGVHTGVATVGNFGSSDRLKYGAAGDTVNTAARLEGVNKFFGTHLLASRAAVDAAGDRDWRPLGRLVLKGRHSVLEVVECLAPDAARGAAVEAYRHAYDLLDQGSPDATRAFAALAAAYPDDPVVRFHHERAARGVASVLVELTEK
jgi:class 3 adenylate cyclase